MPANLYGVANAPGAPYGVGPVGGANVACPSNTETVVCQSTPMIAPSQGFFSCLITGVMTIIYGATVPAAFNYSVKFSTGSDIISLQFAPPAAFASTWQIFPMNAVVGTSATLWQPPGTIVQLTVYPTGQAVTAAQFGCLTYFTLIRAPDA